MIINDLINLSECNINNLLYFTKFDDVILIDNYKEYRAHSV